MGFLCNTSGEDKGCVEFSDEKGNPQMSYSPLAQSLARKFCELYRPTLIWERMSTGRRDKVTQTIQTMIDEGYIRRGVRYDEELS